MNDPLLSPRGPARLTVPVIASLVLTALLIDQANSTSSFAWQVIAITGLALWCGWALTHRANARLTTVLLAGMIVTGSLAAVGTGLLGYASALAAAYVLVAMPAKRLTSAAAACVTSLLLVGVGVFATHADWTLAGKAGVLLLVVALAGLVRRQSRTRQEVEHRALAQQVEIERDRARTAVLEERNRIARDLHDVLAHTLGGLTIQLGAVDAELTAGKIEAATDRVRTARQLSVDGLAEARHAVAALRGEDTDVAAAVLRAVANHRSLGSTIHATIPHTLVATPDVTEALSRAAQELLTNARRHAPGAASTLSLAEQRGQVVLDITTPQVANTAVSPGSGQGLRGLRERIEQLDGRVTITNADAFIVHIEVPA